MKLKFILFISFLFLGISSANANWVAGNSSVSPSSPIPACSTVNATGTFTWLAFSPFVNDLHLATLTYALPAGVVASTGTPSLLVDNVPFTTAIFTQVGSSWNCDFPPATVFPPGATLTFSVSGLDIVNSPSFTNQQLTHFIGFVAGPPGEVYTDNSSTVVFSTIATPTVTASASATNITVGNSVTLTGGGTLTYTWDSAIVQNGVAFMPPVGTHVYTVTGTDANGCTGTSSVTITVNPTDGNWIAGDPSIAPSSPIPACSTMSATGSFTWLSFDPFPNDNHQLTLTFTLPSSVVISSGTPALLDLSNVPVPNTVFTQTSTGYTCTFLPGTIFAPGTKFNFQISNLQIVGTSAFTNQAATHSLAFGIAPPLNESNTDDSSTSIFSTTALPTITASATATAVCAGDSVTLTAVSSEPSFTWNNSVTDGVAFVPPVGTTSYVVTTTAANSCIATDTITVIVNSPTQIDSLVATPSTICFGDNSTILAYPGALSATTYCASSANSTGDSKIDTVSFAGVTTASPAVGEAYTDNTSVTIPIVAGSSYPLNVVNGDIAAPYYGPNELYVYIDYDQSGSFEPSELVYQTSATASNPNSLTPTNITIPASAYNGSTRMRVILHEETIMTLAGNPCGLFSWGETEDYTVVISGGVANPAAFSSISWTPSASLNIASGDSVIAQGLTATTSFTAIGTDMNGCKDTAMVTVNVTPLPVINATAAAANVCLGDSTVLTATGADIYTWSPVAISGNPITVTPTATTSYIVTGTDTLTTCSALDTVTVSVYEPFYVNASGMPASICVGDTVNLMATDSNLTQPFCQATFSTGTGFGDFIDSVGGFGGLIANQTGAGPAPYYQLFPTPVAATAGTPYSLTVRTGSFGGQEIGLWIDYNQDSTFDASEQVGQFNSVAGNTSVTFNVNIPVSAFNGTTLMRVMDDYSGASPVMDPCRAASWGETEDYVLNISGATANPGPVAYTWSWNPGALSGAAQSVAPTTTTTYTVTQTNPITGCTATDSVIVNVLTTPTLALSASPNATVCTGDTVTLMSGATGTNTYTWNGVTAGMDTVLAPATTGTYTVIATDNSTACSATDSIVITVNGYPSFALTATPDTVCSGDSVQLNTTPQFTNNYILTSIPHAPVVPTGTPTLLANANAAVTALSTGSLDDGGWYVSLPFTFDYYGTSNNEVRVWTNGIVSIGNTNTSNGCCSGQVLPNTSTPNGFIALSQDDMDADGSFSPGGTIDYFTEGTAPNRKFVVRYTRVPFYNNAGTPVSTQLVLNETTNNIEMHVDTVDGTVGGAVTMGIEDPTGTLATVIPGRNSTGTFTAINEGWLFTPSPNPGTTMWSPLATLSNATIPNPIANPLATTYYVASITQNGCTATDSVEVTVNPLPTVTATATPDTICPGATVTFTGGGATTYIWDNNVVNGSPISVSSSGTYNVIGTDNNGCINTASTNVLVQGVDSITLSLSMDTICAGGSDTLSVSVCTASQSVFISEVCGFENSAGWTTPTAPIPSALSDPIEITNNSGFPVDFSGWKIEVTGASAGSFIIPVGNIVPAYSVLVLERDGTLAPDPDIPGVYINTTLASAASSSASGFILSDAGGNIVDVVAINGYNVVGTGTPAATAGDWSGAVPSSTSTSGIRRTGLSDMNMSTDWTVASASNLCNYGSLNQTFAPSIVCDQTQPGIGYTWSPSTYLNTTTGPNVIASNVLTTTTYAVSVFDSASGCSRVDSVTITVDAPTLSVSATPSSTVCIGDTVTLMSGATNVTTYTWNGLAASMDTILAPATTGTYTVVATSAFGCSVEDSIIVTVNTPIPFDSIVASPALICSGDTTSIQTFPGISASPCLPTWSSPGATGDYIDSLILNGTNYSTNGDNASDYANLGSVGTYAAGVPISVATQTGPAWAGGIGIWIDFNQSGTFDASEQVYTSISSTAQQTGSITIPTTAYNGTTTMRVIQRYNTVLGAADYCVAASFGEIEEYSITITGASAPVPATPGFATISWSPAANLNATNLATVSAQGLTATATYTATGTAPNGCVSVDSVTITVIPLPTVAGTATPDTICVGGTVALSGTGSAATYSWEPGALVGTTQTVSPTVPTDYILLGVDGTTGCVGRDTVSVYVHPMISLTTGVEINESCPGNADGIAFAVSPGAEVSIFSEGFINAPATSTALPNAAALGWTRSGTGALNWRLDNNGLNSGTTGPISGANTPGYVFLETSSTGGPDTLISPSISLATLTAPINVRFYTHMYGATTNKLELYIDNGAGVTKLWSDSGQIQTSSAAPYTQRLVNLDAYAGQSITLKFVGYRGASFTGDIAIDDIEVFKQLSNSLVWSTTAITDTIRGLGAGTYAVTATDDNGCTANDSVTITVTTPSGDLTQSTIGNIASTPGSACDTFNHPNDGSTYGYYDASCNIIASIQEAVGGTALGSVTTCATVDATNQVYNGQPYVARHFDITPTVQGPANVTLYFTDDDFIDYNANRGSFDSIATNAGSATTATICITQISGGPLGTGTPTVHGPLTATWNATSMRWEVNFPVTGFSSFYCHTCNTPNAALSVEYKNFTVVKQATSDLVEWTTVSEANNSHFNVQRSTDGANFETLGTVQTQAVNGFSTKELNYSFVDETPQIGHNYYRLEQVDMENKMSYTKTIDIIWGASGSVVSIYPNPTKNILNIDLSTDKISQTEIKLLDMSGRVVKAVMAQTIKGMNSITIDMSEVASGIYGIQIFENNTLTHVSKVRKND